MLFLRSLTKCQRNQANPITMFWENVLFFQSFRECKLFGTFWTFSHQFLTDYPDPFRVQTLYASMKWSDFLKCWSIFEAVCSMGKICFQSFDWYLFYLYEKTYFYLGIHLKPRKYIQLKITAINSIVWQHNLFVMELNAPEQ